MCPGVRARGGVAHEQRVGVDIARPGVTALDVAIGDGGRALGIGVGNFTTGIPPKDAVSHNRWAGKVIDRPAAGAVLPLKVTFASTGLL